MKKLRKNGLFYKEIGEKFGLSESYTHLLLNGEPERTTKLRRKICRDYYRNGDREAMKKRIAENQRKRRKNPKYKKKYLEYGRWFYREHRERSLKQSKKWYQTNKEYSSLYGHYYDKYGKKENFPARVVGILRKTAAKHGINYR